MRLRAASMGCVLILQQTAGLHCEGNLLWTTTAERMRQTGGYGVEDRSRQTGVVVQAAIRNSGGYACCVDRLSEADGAGHAHGGRSAGELQRTLQDYAVAHRHAAIAALQRRHKE